MVFKLLLKFSQVVIVKIAQKNEEILFRPRLRFLQEEQISTVIFKRL